MKNKKYRSIIFLVLLLALLFCFGSAVTAATPWDGTADTSWYNTTDTAFSIDTPEKLAGLAKIVNGTADGIAADNFASKTVILTADLDLGGIYASGVWNTETSKKWTPIGATSSTAFAGIFDGNSKNITNLYINTTDGYQGLFAYASVTWKIKNLTIASGSLTGGSRLGSIVAYNDGVILNCTNKAAVNGSTFSGGITGYNHGGYIVNCSNSGAITVTSNRSGGITGSNTGTIINTCNSGTVISTNTKAAGIAGDNSGTIKDSYNTGAVSSSLVSTAAMIGGITGSNTGLVKNVYSAGAVTGALPGTGAILGTNSGTVLNSYYLKTDTVNVSLYSIGGTATVTTDAANTYAKNEADLKAAASSLDSAFMTDSANINGGYPVLSWQVNGYPADETDTLAVESVSAVNGTITMTLNKALAYTNLTLNNFNIVVTSNGNAVTLTSPTLTQTTTETGTVATVAFTAIEAAAAEQTIHISAAYQSGEAKTADYTIAVSNEWFAYAADGFEGGSGTINNPYQVKTAEQLAYLTAQVKAGVNYSGLYIEQIADIDLGSSLDGAGHLTGYNWTPIGKTSTTSFNGNYNGNGYTIRGLAYISSESLSAGLFGFTTSARILNVKIDTPALSTASNVAGLIGYSTNTTVKNCHIIGGNITTSGFTAGGLIATIKSSATGDTTATEIFNCSSSASVCGGIAGGLIGYCTYGTVTNSQPTPYGYVYIENSYATGSVSSNTRTAAGNIGGLVGGIQIINTVHIDHCYATGRLTSKDASNVGGVAGFATVAGSTRVTDVQVTNSAALNLSLTYTGSATISSYSRILGNGTAAVSSGYGTLKNNFALDVMTINGAMVDSENAAGADGANTTKEDFALQETWEDLDFDFSTEGAWIWDANANIPVLCDTAADYAIDISLQPIDATAYSNKEAIFQIKTKNGVGAHSYQWQNSANGTTWNDVEGATDTILSVSGDFALNGYQYRCFITDEGGQNATSNSAALTVKNKKYTAEIAAANLYAVYQKSSALNNKKEPASLYAYQQDISGFAVNLDFYGDYYVSTTVSDNPKGDQPWALIDDIAEGGNPRKYVKSGGATVDTETDLVAEFLAKQTESGAFIAENGGMALDGILDNIYYVLAMDIYFDGAETWGNEVDGTSYGRNGAIEYLFSQLKTDDASDGRYLYSMDPFSSVTKANAQRYQAEFVILMSRFAADATYGKQVKTAMYDVLELLDYLYDNDAITSTETMGRYLSALIAAANATDNHLKQNAYYDKADEVYATLQTALALDGTYTATMHLTTPVETGDATATAAVMMGLSDYVNDNCSLATMGYSISDEDVLNADFSAISLPTTTTTDLTLPTSGTYGTAFTWESSAPACIATDGKVTRQTKEMNVILTATAQFGAASGSKTFTVTVPAAQSADSDAVDAAIHALYIPPETISDLSLPTAGEKDTTIAWATSSNAVISNTGIVARPASGSDDVTVTLIATISKGDVTKTKEFSVLVYAETDDALTSAYQEIRSYYLTHKDLSKSYWYTFAAYAALGDYIQDPDNGYTFYDVSKHKLGQTWQGTDYGAVLLHIIAIGENPYNYNGINYVELAVKSGTTGSYASPVWATLGLEAAGAKDYSPAVSYAIGQLGESAMAYGVDIAGWSVALLSRHLGEAGVDSAIANFTALMKANQSEVGYFVYHSMGSNLISTGCVISGFTALMAADVDGYDVTKAPWLVNGISPIDTMYNESSSDSSVGDFGTQIQIEFADLYNTLYNDGNIMWISCGVTKEKLDDQIVQANAILENEADYTEESITALNAALATVNGISSNRLNAKIADFGEEYYTLYDAVRYAQSLDNAAGDQESADGAKALIDALPAASAIVLTDKDAVVAARSAYDALTAAQKELVDADTLAKLVAAEAAIDALENPETPTPDIADMKDIVTGSWYYDDVAFVFANGIMKGTTESTFAPGEDMTRAQFITILGRYAGIEDSSSTAPVSTKFSDVNTKAYYAAHVAWGVEQGIIQGTTATTFSPSDEISRQDMAVMMARYAAAMEILLPDGDSETKFADDEAISSYAKEAVYQMKAAGVLNGKGNNKFDPKGTALRSEVAAVMHRFIEYAEKEAPVGTATLSVEKFTLGLGYLLEPMIVDVYEDDTVYDIIDRVFAEEEIEYKSDNSGASFYLSAMKDDDARDANIPAYILAEIEGSVGVRGEANWLGEFDYTEQSGWMFWLNNAAPNVSAGATDVADGDVIRWQYTVWGLGLDLGKGFGTAVPYITAADKDALTEAVAMINEENDATKKASAVYSAAIAVLENMESTQTEVDNALAALN